jgi:hypothetical protein
MNSKPKTVSHRDFGELSRVAEKDAKKSVTPGIFSSGEKILSILSLRRCVFARKLLLSLVLGPHSRFFRGALPPTSGRPWSGSRTAVKASPVTGA